MLPFTSSLKKKKQNGIKYIPTYKTTNKKYTFTSSNKRNNNNKKKNQR